MSFYCAVARIGFQSSTISGSESSGVISATVVISGGIVSSKDISVPITYTAGTATSKELIKPDHRLECAWFPGRNITCIMNPCKEM